MLDNFVRWLIGPFSLTPHGFCLLWEPGLIWLHALSDIGVGIAYFTIPLALATFVRRRQDLAFKPVFRLFAAFILLCGTGHWLNMLTFWVPTYGLEGAVKAATAVVSLTTAAALWALLPKALALPSPAQLREANRELERLAEERRLTAEALRNSEARHRTLFNQAPVALYSLDLEGRLVSVSDRWLELLGHADRKDVLGRSITEFLTEDSVCAFRDRWPLFLAEGSFDDVASSWVKHSGDIAEVLVSARRLPDEAGMPGSTMGAVVDVTERRRAEAALLATEERLHQAQKMEAVGQLTGGVTHDFNNVLTAVMGNLDLIRRRVQEDRPDITRLVDTALEAAGRAAGLTAQLLAFSRRQPLDAKPLDPLAVIDGMRVLLTQTAGDRISLQVEADEMASLCLADRNQLESALLNLVINARDAIAGSGSITVSLRVERVEGAPDGWPSDGEYVRIAVRDDGPGMPVEVRRHAFEPFFTTKPTGQGTGLGLAQIHGFAHQSGGTVTIDSAPGQGTEIAILLPRTDAVLGPQAMHGAAAEVPRGRSETVLVVEDNPAVRRTFARMLSDLGYHVLEAEDADAGLALLEGGCAADVVLTDLTMPGSLDGLELAEVVRSRRPALPVILMTAFLDPLRRHRLPPGVGFLQKPCDRAGLAVVMRNALSAAALT